MALTIRSPSFRDGEKIPDKHSKDGRNLSPELQWDGVPEGTRGFALIVEDPDAPTGTFRHWAVYDIPGDRTGLAEGEDVSNYGVGVNDFGNQRYDGPQPPRRSGVHHYHFRLAALNTDKLAGLQGKASAIAAWDKAQKHIIEEAELVGTFEVETAEAG